MNAKAIECLLITANCGSVFEDPSRLLKNWIAEFLSHVKKCKPEFIALHLQEVGGKTYDKSMEYVQEFIKILCESKELVEYNKIRVFLDEDYNSAEHFTALGNLYFAHDSIKNIKIWNFLTHEFESVEGKTIHTGNIESVATKEKAKFPQNFFPESKWSRKGFLRTRFCIEGSTFDLINIHLFHDASNFISFSEQYPSVYCKSRRRALAYVLERIHKDQLNVLVPFFIFGDFNFRCDNFGVVKKLTEDLIEQRIPHLKTDHTKIQYRDTVGSVKFTLAKKEFTHTDNEIFKQDWLKKFDRELDPLTEILYEYPITFSPTYPFEENPDLPSNYMPTRCPSWCDRILMTKAARNLIQNEDDSEYGIIGEDICMGDHKPVFLKLRLKTNQGIVNKCDHIENQQESYKENYYLNESSSKFVNVCEICLKHLNAIIIDTDNTIPLPLSSQASKNNQIMPLVSINVIDDENLNICMCNITDDGICPNCKQQNANKNRKLVSKQTMLGDVIVNRIDSQFLSTTYSSSPSEMRKLKDPYTPESVESHSPLPEMDEKEFGNFINSTSEDDELLENMRDVIKHKHLSDHKSVELIDETEKIGVGDFQNQYNLNHTVSPSQLQTRLEILRRESQLEFSSKSSSGSGSSNSESNKKEKSSLHSKCCLCYAVIENQVWKTKINLQIFQELMSDSGCSKHCQVEYKTRYIKFIKNSEICSSSDVEHCEEEIEGEQEDAKREVSTGGNLDKNNDLLIEQIFLETTV
ncbi:hypothetical protein PVAND_001795 [Polypedilum vanderplanki]|uniref:inositol-polyphosphate 5-phosphatase n=1 Tax=Polypedilum vanderplanki TaxID=319348 RepID=A0A9J6BPB5_POLVA|nr:hypothetical protein PVAND_001795 [Polypedilum vanderplanki]